MSLLTKIEAIWKAGILYTLYRILRKYITQITRKLARILKD